MMKDTMNNNTTLKFLFVFLVAITCFAQKIVVVEGKNCYNHKECEGDTITSYDKNVICNGYFGCDESK